MSRLSQYLNRSAQVIRDSTMRMVLMKGADMPSLAPRTLFSFNSQEDLKEFAIGCDADVGGTSTVHFELCEDENVNKSIGRQATGVFWGDMRLGVRAGLESQVRGGYAAFRNKKRPTLFGELAEDISNHRYLALRVRAGGDSAMHDSYFCNIIVGGPIATDLWQHRLFFRRRDGGWEDILIPIQNFIRVKSGQIAERKVEMYKENVLSIGISLLGGRSGIGGRYELGIDSISITNDENPRPDARERSKEDSAQS